MRTGFWQMVLVAAVSASGGVVVAGVASNSASGTERPSGQYATVAQVQQAQATANRALALVSRAATITYLSSKCVAPSVQTGNVGIIETPGGQGQYDYLIPLCSVQVVR